MAGTDDEKGAKGPVETTLTEAARAAEAEIDRFEALVASVRKIDLGSEKSIVRAGRALGEAVAAQTRIAAVLPPLAAAFTRAQHREQVSAELLQACALQVQERTRLFNSLMEGIRDVGRDALEVTSLLKAATEADREPAGAAGGMDAKLEAALERMDHAVGKARDLRRLASEAEFADVVRQAEALHQQLTSVRSKLQRREETELN